MTDPIARLAAIVAKRTPGPWHQDYNTVFHGVHHVASCRDGLNYAQDGAFIALMGSCADEILAVIRTADRLTDNIAEFDTVTDSIFVENVDDALAALKTKLAAVLPHEELT